MQEREKFRPSNFLLSKLRSHRETCSVETLSEIDRFFEKRNAREVFGLNCDTVSDFVGGWMGVAQSMRKERMRERGFKRTCVCVCVCVCACVRVCERVCGCGCKGGRERKGEKKMGKCVCWHCSKHCY